MLNLSGKKEEKKPFLPKFTPAGTFFGVLLGSIAGLIPLLSPPVFLIAVIFLVFRIDFIAGAIFFAAGKFVTEQYLGAFINKLGLAVLTGPLIDFSVWFTRLPVIAYLNFNNTEVMGGAVIGLAAGLPAAFVITECVKMIAAKKAAKEKTAEQPDKNKKPPAPNFPSRKPAQKNSKLRA